MRFGALLGTVLGLALFAGDAQAQYSLSMTSDEGPAGSTLTSATLIDSSAGGELQGWSYGVCVTEGPATATAIIDVVDGATTAGLNGGVGPDFTQINILPGGWTVGLVISFLGTEALAPGSGYEANVGTYTVSGDAGDFASLDYCSTLGDPAVSVVVVSGGASIPPATTGGTLTVVDIPLYLFIAPDLALSYDPATGAASLTGNVSIEATPEGGFALADTQGFSMGLGHDPAVLAATGIAAIGELADVNGGAGPDFFGDNLFPDGWTVGVVYAFLGGVFIQFDVPKEVIAASYDATLTGGGTISTDLTWRSDLGSPPVANVVVVDGQSLTAATDGPGSIGTLTFEPIVNPPFIRGDCNADSIVNIADGVWILNNLFQGGPGGPCAASCDTNGDGMLDQSDAIAILNYRFLDGPPPAAPFPDCAADPAVTPAECADYTCP